MESSANDDEIIQNHKCPMSHLEVTIFGRFLHIKQYSFLKGPGSDSNFLTFAYDDSRFGLSLASILLKYHVL